MSNIVETVSRRTMAILIEKLKEEAEALAEHPCGVFDFSSGGGISLKKGCEIDPSIKAIQGALKGDAWYPPDNSLIAPLYLEPGGTAYYVLRTDYTDPQKQCVRILSKSQSLFVVICYDDIPERIRAWIERLLVEKAWKLLKNNALISMEPEGE